MVSESHHNLCPSPDSIEIIKSRRNKCLGHKERRENDKSIEIHPKEIGREDMHKTDLGYYNEQC